MVKVCYNHTSKEFNKCLRAGNCCLRHPFSPVLEPRQGGDICSLAGLTWPQVIFSSNNVLLAVQAWGTPSAWHHVPRPLPPSGGFHPVGGLYPSLASIFPAHYCPLHHLVSFLRAITLINNFLAHSNWSSMIICIKHSSRCAQCWK